MSALRTSHPRRLFVSGTTALVFGVLAVLLSPKLVLLGREALILGPGTLAAGIVVGWLATLPFLVLSTLRDLVVVEDGQVRTCMSTLLVFRFDRHCISARDVECVRFANTGRRATVGIVLKDGTCFIYWWSSYSFFARRLALIGRQWAAALDVDFYVDD